LLTHMMKLQPAAMNGSLARISSMLIGEPDTPAEGSECNIAKPLDVASTMELSIRTPVCKQGDRQSIGKCQPKFSICLNGQYNDMFCPAENVYNDETKSCTSLAQCGGISQPVIPEMRCTRHEEIAPCSNEFRFCNQGELMSSLCPDGTVFVGNSQKCEMAAMCVV